MSITSACKRAARAINPVPDWTVNDQHGRRVPVFQLSQNLLDHPDPSLLMTREEVRSLRRECMRSAGCLIRFATALFFFLAAAHLFLLINTPNSNIVTRLGLAALYSFMGVVVMNRTLGRNPEVVALALRRRRRCASCAYDMNNITPDPDGCTTCPECGSAWRLAHPDPAPRP